MIQLNSTDSYNSWYDALPNNASVGFVPTMGALHNGHLALVKKALKENTHVVCSIFINPTQFNNAKDFKNYPNTLPQDLALLKSVGCNLAFVPSKKEVYPHGTENSISINISPLDTVMEGAHRPGHFKGVCQVVNRLFEVVSPHKAYFGEKDFQQLMVIKRMVKETNQQVEIIPCPTVRQETGLALSSRNLRLSDEERSLAVFIYAQLQKVKGLIGSHSIEEIKTLIAKEFSNQPKIDLEYFEIAEENNLQPVKQFEQNLPIRAFIAAFLGDVRLIDNLRLFP